MVNSSSAAAVVVDITLFPYAMWMTFATRRTMMNDGTGIMMAVVIVPDTSPCHALTPNSLMMTGER